jgi:hypothetical protein
MFCLCNCSCWVFMGHAFLSVVRDDFVAAHRCGFGGFRARSLPAAITPDPCPLKNTSIVARDISHDR